ncbi:PTR2 [Candida pseudojiufengensis]|uniref:PTR2 n=1 Tax=Candida pseudojiufengensis TaxID=497109 RepID=UPI002223FBD2|nr:PTR2 [Candida pseudojiufengensis]KAI5968058.1 PTR2 [Candida pseudojiufengensis]
MSHPEKSVAITTATDEFETSSTTNVKQHDITTVTKSLDDEQGSEKVLISKDESNSSLEEDDEGRDPTEYEMKTLRHVSGKIPLSAWLIAIVELAERFSYYGLSAPFQNYMQNGPDDNPSGMLDLGQQGATALSYFFQFWCYVTPIFGGWLADTYWGKYKTIFVASIIYSIGIFILFITSIPSITNKSIATGGFITAIIIIGIGTGLIKTNVSPYLADQVPKRKAYIRVEKNGERVIVTNALTIQRIFAIFYMCINVGSLSVLATTSLRANVAYYAAYLLTFCFFFIAIFCLIVGKNRSVQVPVGDRIINETFRCSFQAMRDGFTFKNVKSNVITTDEIKRTLYACKIFLFYPFYWVTYGQMVNNFVSSAGSMNNHGLPNDILQAFNSLSIILFIPLMEKIIYPFIRKWTPFKPITRIFFGFMFATSAMIYAAVLQHFIYSAGPCFDHPSNCTNGNNIHIAWQTPAYCLIALSEIFSSVVGLEYSYSKAAVNMKSFVMSLFLFTNAIGSALGIALSPVSTDPKMVWTYSGLGVSCFIAGVLFWFIYSGYNAREDEWNEIEFAQNNTNSGLVPVTSFSKSIKSLA